MECHFCKASVCKVVVRLIAKFYSDVHDSHLTLTNISTL